MKLLPQARNENVVVQEIGKEVLIYDLQTHKAFNLNGTSAAVYKSCDGFTSFEELRIRHKFTDEIIFLSLDELKKHNLVADDYDSPFAGISRREAIRKVGLASMIALPVISSLVAPTAAHAQSGAGNLALYAACTSSPQCASGNCAFSQCCTPGSTNVSGRGAFLSTPAGNGTCSGTTQAYKNSLCSTNAVVCCGGATASNCQDLGLFFLVACNCN